MANHVVLNGPAKLKRVYYRRSLSRKLGGNRTLPLASTILRDGKSVIIYSPYDLTSGLAGYEGFSLQGYKPQSALSVMTNLLCNAAGLKLKSPKATEKHPTASKKRTNFK